MSYSSVFSKDLFRGTRVIVTAGGSGIGRCMAHELAILCSELLLPGRTGSKLQRVKEEITEEGGSVEIAPCDVRETDQLESVKGRVKPVDVLVNCAAGQFPALLSEMITKGPGR